MADKRRHGCRSAGSLERAEARKAAAIVRRRGTGSPDPRQSRMDRSSLAFFHAADRWKRRGVPRSALVASCSGRLFSKACQTASGPGQVTTAQTRHPPSEWNAPVAMNAPGAPTRHGRGCRPDRHHARPSPDDPCDRQPWGVVRIAPPPVAGDQGAGAIRSSTPTAPQESPWARRRDRHRFFSTFSVIFQFFAGFFMARSGSGTPRASPFFRRPGTPGQVVHRKRKAVNKKGNVLMNISSGSADRAAVSRWSLTQVDLLLCALPIAVFLSIVSLV